MPKNNCSHKPPTPEELKTPPSKKKREYKDSPDTTSTTSLSSMSMSIDSPPFKGMKKQDIPWTNKDYLEQAFNAVGFKGSLDKVLNDSQSIELLLGNKRKPYEITLHKLGIENSWSEYKTKEFRNKVAEVVANTLQRYNDGLKTEGLKLDFSSLKGEAVVQPMANIHYTVSYGIKDSQGNHYYYIIIDKPGKAWMMKSGFLGTLFNVVINQHLTPQGKEVPYFMKHFHEVPLKGPDGKYKRNKKNYVGTRVATVVRVPKTGLPPNLCITNAIDQIGNFMKRDDIGEMFANWLAREIPALYRHFAGNKTGGPPKVSKGQIGSNLTETFNEEFSSYACDKDIHLSNVLCNYEIKQFLVHHLGCNSFEDIADTELGKIFSYYPQKTLPTWEDIKKESY